MGIDKEMNSASFGFWSGLLLVATLVGAPSAFARAKVYLDEDQMTLIVKGSYVYYRYLSPYALGSSVTYYANTNPSVRQNWTYTQSAPVDGKNGTTDVHDLARVSIRAQHESGSEGIFAALFCNSSSVFDFGEAYPKMIILDAHDASTTSTDGCWVSAVNKIVNGVVIDITHELGQSSTRTKGFSL